MMFGMEPEEISSLYEEHSTVIQSVREGIIVIDQNGMIRLVNQAAYDILSLDEQRNIIGEFILDVIPNSTILDVLQTGEEQFDRQLNIKGQAVIANRLPIKVKNKVTGVVSSLRLKSEMDQLTAELSQTKQYTEALRAQTHEYNNLLYTLSGLIQLESYEDALELIHKETAVYQDFVQFIMKRIQNPWLGGILIGFYNRARELKIDFMLDRESSLDKLSPHIESNYVVSILGNLITNAFEAIERNEEHNKKVRMFVTDIGEEIVIEVEDSGQGIHDEVITSIFYKGFSTKEGEKRGYGLAKVKELVEDLNGSIAIEKRGFRWCIVYYCITERERRVVMGEEIEVLIVEDDIRIADIHRRFTGKIEGFKVIGTATTGEQAKEWLDLVKPQLVLLDVYLPDMQGTELVTYIRHNLHDTDIIMITAASETDVVRHALRGGVTDYIVKPLMFDRFKTSLENYKKKLVQLKKNNQLSIEQIEHLWSQRGVKGNEIEYAPKGIDPLTLAKIKKAYVNSKGRRYYCGSAKLNGRSK